MSADRPTGGDQGLSEGERAYWREKGEGNCANDRGGYYAAGFRHGYEVAARADRDAAAVAAVRALANEWAETHGATEAYCADRLRAALDVAPPTADLDTVRRELAADHIVHVTAEPVAEDVVWCDECEEWVSSGAPEPSTSDYDPKVCTDPACTIPRKPGRPIHGPHDFRAARADAVAQPDDTDGGGAA